MNDSPSSLFATVQSGIDRERAQAKLWSGTFDQYLKLVEDQPLIARNSWQRLLDMIESYGFEPSQQRGVAKRWRIFDDPFDRGRDAVYGLDHPLSQLVQTVRAGAQRFGPEKRVILLHGPVGSAKSTIVRLIKRGLEAYSRSPEGAIYTFEWEVDGEVIPSPMHQDPLLLVPRSLRKSVEDRLNEGLERDYRIEIEGELDPVSRYYLTELSERYDGDWQKVLGHVRVKQFHLSEQDRVGVGTFQPKDEKNQDSTELTGDVNYRLIAEYGSDSDPRAFNFDGEFNIANRGILEFVEVLKLDVAFLYDLLGASQEHAIKPKKFAQTHIDEVIIGHTNEPEYRKLQNNELMEAFRDRTIKIDIPYNLSVENEVKIYRRQFNRDSITHVSVAPHTMEIAALWAILTRLEDPTHPNLTILQKAKLYNGEDVQGFTSENVREMHESAQREGMFGISPRYVQDRIATALVSEKACVGPRDIMEAIEEGLEHHSLITNEDVRKRYAQLLSHAREEYEEMIKHEVQVAVAADREAVDRLCGKYIDNIKAYTTREKLIDAHGTERDPDERLMRSIEMKIDIPESRKDDFRHEMMNYIAALHIEGKRFDYRQNKRLMRALELKLFEDRRDTIQLTSLVSTVVDPDTQGKIAVIRTRLKEQFGYSDESAEDVLQYVAALFARGEAKEGTAEAA